MPSADPVVIHLDVDAPGASRPSSRLVSPPLGRLGWLRAGSRPDANSARVPLPALGDAAEEHWIGSEAATRTHTTPDGLIHYAADGQWLIGHLHIADAEDIDDAAFRAYRGLGNFIAGGDYPYLLRTWNFLDRLNEGLGDAERYRRFCTGRHRAIAQPGFEARLPAATVIGCDAAQAPGLHLSFLAATLPGLQIENPRQTSAFRYPRDYGPASPSFSRATLVGPHLLVSGTAAVVGHLTRHPHDAVAQADEIAANLEALLVHARNTHLAGIEGRWAAQALRLYVRQPQDAPAAVERLRSWIPASVPLAVLRGDISRADLMIEVEGVWTFQAGG